MIPLSNAEEEPDRQSSVHAPILITTLPDDTSEEEEEDRMALNKGSKTLKELMAVRNQVSTSKEANKSQIPAHVPANLPLPPPPLQVPNDLGLKPLPEMKKKRPNEVLEEGKVGL